MLAPTKVGDVYGKLTVLRLYRKELRGSNRLFAICSCTCGGTTDDLVTYLRIGQTKSCRCSTSPLTHGKTGTVEYSAWGNMWARCSNPKNAGYPQYKDRAPPESWRKFENFIADMGLRPSSEHTLERVDNEKGYSKDNCVWLLKNEQAKNRSITRWLTNGQVTVCFTEACRLSGIAPSIVFQRINKLHWPIDLALGPEWSEVPTRFPAESVSERADEPVKNLTQT